jgi:hypothetical protein
MSTEPSSTPPAGSPGAEARQRIGPWQAFWICVMLFAVALFARDIANTNESLSIGGDALWGRDFVNVYTSGTLVLQGRLDLLYDPTAYQAFQDELFGGGLRYHLFSYPPVALLYGWLFALLPYPLALLLWVAGTGALFVLAARPYLRDAGLPAWIAIAAPASLVNIWAGHYGFVIGALWLAAWHLLARRPVAAGILVGLMVVKPHLAVLMPIVLLWRREWTAFAAAAATVLALVGLSAALFGPELWLVYVTEVAAAHAAMVDDVGTFFLLLMPTLTPALAMLGVPILAATAVQAIVGIAAIVLLLRHMPRDDRRAGLATATATFLVLPYGFAYDMTVAGLAGLILLRESLGRRSPAFTLLVALTAIVPLAVMYFNRAGVPGAPLLIAFQLSALLGLMERERATRPPG